MEMRMRHHAVGLLAALTLFLGLLTPRAAHAQRPAPVPRIGVLLFSGPDAPAVEAFRHGLREHGWVEGQNLTIEWRYADGHAERLPALAADLVRLPVDVLVTHGLTIRPAQEATQTIPIVMAIVTDPVGSGLVASLARPGGNLTGLSIGAAELGGKRLELLMQAVPQATRVAVLWNAALADKVPEWQGTQTVAQAGGSAALSGGAGARRLRGCVRHAGPRAPRRADHVRGPAHPDVSPADRGVCHAAPAGDDLGAQGLCRGRGPHELWAEWRGPMAARRRLRA